MQPRTRYTEEWQETIKPLVAEFVGTFLLVFTVGCQALSPAPPAYGPTAIAFTLMIVVYVIGPISGGHVNPAVTVGLVGCGKEIRAKILPYLFVQYTAALCAGFSYKGVFGHSFPLGPKPGFSWWSVMICEMLYTGMLVFVVLNVATSRRNNPATCKNQFFGLAIGFVIIAGGYAAGPVSGGVFNPAVAFAIDVTDFDSVVQMLVYSIWEFIGAAVAVALYKLVRPEDFQGDPETYSVSLSTRLAAEYIGTFMVVLTYGLNTLGNSPAGPWSVAAALLCMIYSLGDVSGSHLNPAVTISIRASGRRLETISSTALFILTQTISGIFAGLMYVAIYDGQSFELAAKPPYSLVAASFMEFLYTFLLCFAVLSTATTLGVPCPMWRNYYFGLAIAAIVVAGGFAVGKVSGGVLNPAIATGVLVSSAMNSGSAAAWWRYLLAQILAAFCASGAFRITHTGEYHREPSKIAHKVNNPDSQVTQ